VLLLFVDIHKAGTKVNDLLTILKY